MIDINNGIIVPIYTYLCPEGKWKCRICRFARSARRTWTGFPKSKAGSSATPGKDSFRGDSRWRLRRRTGSSPVRPRMGKNRRYGIARLQEGEFGIRGAAAVLDVIGVDPDAQGKGIGKAVIAAIEEQAKKRNIGTLRTQVAWGTGR